jgi:hypothetical protein
MHLIKLFVRTPPEVTVAGYKSTPMHQFGIFPRLCSPGRNFPFPRLETHWRGSSANAATKPPNLTNLRRIDMHKTIQTALALVGITLGLAIAPAIAQSDSDSKMKMSKMSDKDTTMALDKMSKQEKAALFDKMSDVDKMMATKMAGHDMSKMNAGDRMAMTDKMSADDKAMMYEKMAKGKHMDKMDKAAMDKAAMDKMKK